MVEQTALIKVIRRCVAGSSPVRSPLIMGSIANCKNNVYISK